MHPSIFTLSTFSLFYFNLRGDEVRLNFSFREAESSGARFGLNLLPVT